LPNSNFQKLKTEVNFNCEAQNDLELKSKKKIISSNDLFCQTFDAQNSNMDSDAHFSLNPSKTGHLESLACDENTDDNSNSNNNFPPNSNSNLAFAQTENKNNFALNYIKEKEKHSNTMDMDEIIAYEEVNFARAVNSKKCGNSNLNLNINNNFNFNSNSNTEKNLKNNSAFKQNMVKAPINQSPVEARNLCKPAAYYDENQMDIEVSNDSIALRSDNLNSNTNNTKNLNNNNISFKTLNSYYANESNMYISTKDNLKINSAAEGKFCNTKNENNNNNNKKNFSNKKIKHNYNNYKKKSPAGAYSKSVSEMNNIANNGNNHINQNAIRQNITNISTIPNNNNNTNINQNQISANTITDHYSKFIPILQKHEKSIPLEYIPDIWRNLKSSENCTACMPKYGSLLNQTDINFDMRAILIDWIIDVHKNYRLLPETLFICVSIIDRYLTKKQILRTRLQLLGTTALFIASKYEEIIYPCIDDFTKVTDDAYNKEEVLKMEYEIFELLEFDLTYPSPYRFFEIISLNYNFSEVEFYFGCYLLEYFLISPNSNKYFPSVIALAVVLLILKMKSYENYRDLYSLTDSLESQRLVKQCAKEIYEFPATCKNFNLFSVFNKYSSSLFHSVALNELDGHHQPMASDGTESHGFKSSSGDIQN